MRTVYLHSYLGRSCFATIGEPSREDVAEGIRLFMPTGPRSVLFKTAWRVLARFRLFPLRPCRDEAFCGRLNAISDAIGKARGDAGDDGLFFFPSDPLNRRFYLLRELGGAPVFWKAAFDVENRRRIKKEYDSLQNPLLGGVRKPTPVVLVETEAFCLTGFAKEEMSFSQHLSAAQENALFALLRQMENRGVCEKTLEECSWWRLELAQLVDEKIARTPVRTSLAHGDVAPQNVGFGKDGAVLIDWEDFTPDAPCGTDFVRYLSHKVREKYAGRPSLKAGEEILAGAEMTREQVFPIALFLISLDSTDKPNYIGKFVADCFGFFGA